MSLSSPVKVSGGVQAPLSLGPDPLSKGTPRALLPASSTPATAAFCTVSRRGLHNALRTSSFPHSADNKTLFYLESSVLDCFLEELPGGNPVGPAQQLAFAQGTR